MNSSAGFSRWYKAKLGHLSPLVQGALWFLYGFIWIPLWYFSTRNNSVGTNAVGGSEKVSSQSSERPLTPATQPRRVEPVWPAIPLGDRLFALLAVKPVAVEIAEHEDPAHPKIGTIRIQRWNYTRIFALAWAGLSLIISLWNAPRPGGPTTVDLFFMMAGLLYVLFAFLQIFNGTYWKSFVVVSEYSSLPLIELDCSSPVLLAACCSSCLRLRWSEQ